LRSGDEDNTGYSFLACITLFVLFISEIGRKCCEKRTPTRPTPISNHIPGPDHNSSDDDDDDDDDIEPQLIAP